MKSEHRTRTPEQRNKSRLPYCDNRRVSLNMSNTSRISIHLDRPAGHYFAGEVISGICSVSSDHAQGEFLNDSELFYKY